jgi:3-hydroxyacyl-CoA dehydrogenase/enoyl-CoA hydratase/3-hydroxybutyryl-CoA epimerase
VPKQEYKKIGILGAGLMGSGIATLPVQAGLDIVLVDRDQAAADKGKAHIAGELDKLVKRGRLDQARRDALLAKVTATPDFGALKDVQIVIEAVFENREVKAEATKKAEAAMPKEAVFASNTSTLPITGLAEARRSPTSSSACTSSRRSRRCRWSRSSSARRPRPRPWPAPWTSCRRSARRRSW